MVESTPDRMPLRDDGWIRVAGDAVEVDRADGEGPVTIPAGDIRKLNLEVVDWGLVVFSAAAVVFGAYFAVSVNVVAGVVVALVGAWSIHRSYRRRYTLVLWVEGRSEPVAVRPTDPETAHAAVAKLIRPDETPVTARA